MQVIKIKIRNVSKRGNYSCCHACHGLDDNSLALQIVIKNKNDIDHRQLLSLHLCALWCCSVMKATTQALAYLLTDFKGVVLGGASDHLIGTNYKHIVDENANFIKK